MSVLIPTMIGKHHLKLDMPGEFSNKVLQKCLTTTHLPLLSHQRGSGAAPLRAAEGGQHPAGVAIRRTGGNPEAGLWKTQPYLPKILRSGSKHRLQEIRLWNAVGLKTALHKYDNQFS